MDPPSEGIELKPEILEEEKDGGPLLHCDFCDADIVDKIAQSFLPGLASACIDNTTGGLFKTAANVAVEIRKEMVDYLIQRSENFVAEAVVLEGGADVEVTVDPFDIISDFVDDFVHSKRNFFSRVSGFLLSEKREDWIDDLVQEMELNGFWLLNRRLTVAQSLLKNLDFKNTYHCNMTFRSPEDLEKHRLSCGFRTMSCNNEGCDSSCSAAHMNQHDSVCPFKMLPCEQNCPDIILRREMDRHCITTCPMKLVKCPLHSVGCQSTVPQSTMEQHRSESISSHLLYVLQVSHKEASPEDLKERVQELEKIASPGRLASARDARSLTYVVKDLEAKLGTLKVKPSTKSIEEVKVVVAVKEEKTDTQAKHVEVEDKNEEKIDMADKHVRSEELSTENEGTATDNSHSEVSESISWQEHSKDRSSGLSTPPRVDDEMQKSSKEVVEEHSIPTIEQKKLRESTMEEPVERERILQLREEERSEAMSRDVEEESVPVERERILQEN